MADRRHGSSSAEINASIDVVAIIHYRGAQKECGRYKEQKEDEVVSMPYAVIDDGAVMVEAFDAPAAGHAMDGGGGPDGSTEEAEIIEVSPLFNCFIEINIELF